MCSSDLFEYPIALLLALLLRPRDLPQTRFGRWVANLAPIVRAREMLQGGAIGRFLLHPRLWDIGLPVLLWVVVAGNRMRSFLIGAAFTVYGWFYSAFGGMLREDFSVQATTLEKIGKVLVTAFLLVAVVWMGRRRPLRFALGVLALLLALTPDMLLPSGPTLRATLASVGLNEQQQDRFREIFEIGRAHV